MIELGEFELEITASQQAKQERLLSLPIGQGLTFLLDSAASILGNPVLAHDMDYKLLAHTQNVISDDPIWNEFIANGTVSPERIDFYKYESFLDEAANAKNVTFLYSDKLPYKRIYGKLFNIDRIQIGCACITESQNPFGQDAAQLFACLCDILNREIAADDFFTVYGQDYQKKLIELLLNGKIDDKGIYTAHVESLYNNMDENLYVAVVEFDCSENSAAYREIFKGIYPNFKYSACDNHLIILVSSPVPCLEFPQLERLLGYARFRVGVSKRFDNLFNLSDYYQQALCALRKGSALNENQRIFLSE